MTRVLFMEDEPTIQEVLAEYMKMQSYEVTAVSTGTEALDCLQREKFDMAVLDIMVPEIDGLSVLEKLRSENNDMAVIMLTALEDENTQVRAFNLYADDYVIKPVSPLILLKRMETILRRTKNLQERKKTEISILTEGLTIDKEAYEAQYNGIPLKLTLSEFLLLTTLYEHKERVFSREQLILQIFNEDYIGNDRIIDAHVKNLRKKLPIDCIKTVIGIGYRYSEEVPEQ